VLFDQREGQTLPDARDIIAVLRGSSQQDIEGSEGNLYISSESHAEEPGLSTNVQAINEKDSEPAAGSSEAAKAESDKMISHLVVDKPSVFSRENDAGRPTRVLQLGSKAAPLAKSGKDKIVSRRSEAFSEVNSQPQCLVKHSRTWQASRKGQMYNCARSLYLQKGTRPAPERQGWVLSDGLAGRSAWGKRRLVLFFNTLSALCFPCTITLSSCHTIIS
jgi:hypothetical protein